jgi:hypothetical protein
VEKIAQIFDAYFGQWGIQLPVGRLTADHTGRISAAGWTIHYRFGADAQSDYLDFYAAHRMTHDRHVRIRATGETEILPALLDAIIYPADATDEQRHQTEQEYRCHNIAVTNELRRKGFL